MTPVNVFSKIPKEEFFISPSALLDILLIALMLIMTASKFVLAPGMTMEVGGGENVLPDTNAPDFAGVDSDLSVLTMEGSSMLIFDGSIYNMRSLERKMKNFKRGGDVLLIKADKHMPIQSLIDIAEIAKKGGFKKIHIAAKPKK